jgi:phosphatidylinositol-3-phosphatase
MRLQDFTPQAPSARWGAHVMPWFAKGSNSPHMDVNYDSDDPATIARQAELMQQWGIEWINVDFYASIPTIVSAAKLWLAECARRGMGFSLMMDGNAKLSTQAMLNALATLGWAFNSPAYKRDASGKLEVADFQASVDWAQIQSQYPNHSFLHVHQQVGWINAAAGAGAIAKAQQENAAIGAQGWQAAWPGFHDNDWGAGPERYVDYRDGQTFKDSCATITADCRDILLVTWNDHDERTGIERNLDEASGKAFLWPPPVTGKYLWPLPLDGIFDSAPAPTPAPTPSPTPMPSTKIDHIFCVFCENLGYDAALKQMPYLASLASKYTLYTNYYANTHPSIGNYFYLTTGRNITNDDAFTGTVPDPTIVSMLQGLGRTCRSYAEGLTSGTKYLKRHNPFAYFANKPPGLLADFTQLAPDIASSALPDFAYVMPNSINSGHDGSYATADNWLKIYLPQLLSIPNSLVYVMFDEAADSDTTHGGGHIVVIEAGTLAAQGQQNSTFMQHSSMYAKLYALLSQGMQPQPTPTPTPTPVPPPSPSTPAVLANASAQVDRSVTLKYRASGNTSNLATVRMEVWAGNTKLAESQGKTIDVGVWVPPNITSIIIQAVGAGDKVLEKASIQL